MTTAASSRKQIYLGSGSTGPFTFSFPIADADEVTITKTSTAGVNSTLVSPTNYSLTLVSNGVLGGAVTLVVALATGEKLTIEGTTPHTQEASGRLTPEAYEAALDKLTHIVQEMQQQLNRCIQIPSTDQTGTTVLLDTEDERASKIMATDADGNITMLDSTVTSDSSAAASAAAAAASAAAAAASAASINLASIAITGGTIAGVPLVTHLCSKTHGLTAVQDYTIGYFDYACTLSAGGQYCTSGSGATEWYLSPDETSASGTLITGGSFTVNQTEDLNTFTGNNAVTAGAPRFLIQKVTASTLMRDIINTLKITKNAEV